MKAILSRSIHEDWNACSPVPEDINVPSLTEPFVFPSDSWNA